MSRHYIHELAETLMRQEPCIEIEIDVKKGAGNARIAKGSREDRRAKRRYIDCVPDWRENQSYRLGQDNPIQTAA